MKRTLYTLLALLLAAPSSADDFIYVKKRVAAAAAPSWQMVASDNFNRANENPLGNGDWTTQPGFNALKIVDNVVYASTEGAYAVSYWSGHTFGNDQACVFTATGTGNYQGCIIRGSGASSFSGYMFQLDANNTAAYIFRYDSGTQTQLGATTTTMSKAAGVKYKFEIVGTTITIYEDVGAGWVNKDSRTDSTHASGYVGLMVYNSSTCQEDNFEGWSYE